MNRLRSASVRTWLSGLVLAALFALQTLGAMHGVLHAGDDHGHSHGRHHGDEAVHSHGIAKLFGGHAAGGADCHLYDQLAHGDAAATTPPFVAEPPLSFALAAAKPALAPTLEARFFQARGPPASA